MKANFGLVPKIGSAAAALLVLGACAGLTGPPELQSLRQAEPEGAAFSQALSREYLVLANFEADEMVDWRDAQRFTRKGLRAAAGEIVPPEDFGRWRIPEAHRPTLSAARARLVAALGAGAADAAPDDAARAQAHFDCWVEQQEENWQVDHIAACRSGFETAMTSLDRALAQRGGPEPATRQFAERSPTPLRPMRLQFGFDSYLLDSEAMTVVNEAAAAINERGGNVTITGHADRAGTEPYNWALSLQRASTVQAALIEKGVSASSISVVAAGETDRLVETADGVRESKNRRVELRFGSNKVAFAPADKDPAPDDPVQRQAVTSTVAATRANIPAAR